MWDQYTQAMVDFVESKIGRGYIMGATGWTCSLARREQQATQYPEYRDMIMGTGAKWDGVQCFDCAQLVRFAVEAGGGKLPSGATSQWNSQTAWQERGTNGTLPQNRPCILYRERGGVMQHTGISLGNGWVVDARDTARGVIKTTLDIDSWTHWGIPVLGNINANEGVNNMQVPYTAIIRTKTGNGVSLWNDSGKTTKKAQIPEGAMVNVIGIPDDRGFVLATYGGYTGVVDSQYLVPVSNPGTPGEISPEIIAALGRVAAKYAELGAEIAALRGLLGV